MISPKIRADLQSHSVEEEGIRYVDVSDPRAGTSMRLYEHEWLLARRLDGAATFDEVARWAAGANLGFAPSAADLEAYARALAGLGFFDEKSPSAEASTNASVPLDATPVVAPIAAHTDQPAIEPATSTDEPALLVEREPAHPPVFAPRHDAPAPAAALAEAAAGPAAVSVTPPIAEPAPSRPLTEATAPTMTMPAVVPQPAPEQPTVPSAMSFDQTLVAGTLPMAPTEPAAVTSIIERDNEQPKKKSRAGWVLATLLVLGGGGAAAYQYVLAPMLSVAQVQVMEVAAPIEVVHYAPSNATVQASPAETLSFASAGQVVDALAVGTVVKPGDVLATLNTFAALDKARQTESDKLARYQALLERAKVKGDKVTEQTATKRIAIVQKRLDDMAPNLAAARLVATTGGTIAMVLAPAGSSVEPGTPAVQVIDPRLHAELAGDPVLAERHHVGDTVTLASADGKTTLVAKVDAVQGGTLRFELPDDATAKTHAGASLRMVSERLSNVLAVPAQALTKSPEGADQLFVLDGEVLRARTVTVVEREGNLAYVSTGIATGDHVVRSGLAGLHDGQRAAVAH